MYAEKIRRELKKLFQINEFDPKKPYLRIPGMVSRSERKNLFRQSSKLSGKGHILEFGAFFGASTSAILSGLKLSNSEKEFHVYDYFKTNDPWFSEVTRSLAGEYEHLLFTKDGWLDFSKVYESFINDPIVQTHKILIQDFIWKKEPIEFIHLDLPKDWAQAERIATQTFPFLVQESKIIFQDFVNQWSYEIGAMIGFLLREEYIRIEGNFGSTLSTTAEKNLTQNAISLLVEEMKDASNVLKNFDYAFTKAGVYLNEQEKIILRVGRSILIYETDKDQGLSELSRVIDYLVPAVGRGGKALKNALEFGLQAKKSIN